MISLPVEHRCDARMILRRCSRNYRSEMTIAVHWRQHSVPHIVYCIQNSFDSSPFRVDKLIRLSKSDLSDKRV
jgi:hypothetical protein